MPLELLCRRIVGQLHRQRQNALPDPSHPFAPAAQRLHHLLETRVHRERRPRAAQRRRQKLCQKRTCGLRLEKDRAVVILHRGSRSQRGQLFAFGIELLPHHFSRGKLCGSIRVNRKEIV